MSRYTLFSGFLALLIFFANTVSAQQDNFGKGFEAFNEGNYTLAIQYYSAHLEKQFSINALFNRGLAYYEQGDYPKAIADYTLVIETDSLDFEAYYNRGLAYYQQGEFDKAIADFRKTFFINPDYYKAYLSLGLCYYNMQQYGYATGWFDLAIDKDSAYATAYYNRALANKYLKDDKQAESDFKKAISLNPVANYYWGLAEFYFETGKYDLSVEAYNNAIEINPVEPNLYYNRGISFYSAKNYENAIEDFQQTLKFNENDIDALWYLAKAYKDKGDNVQALFYYELVESLDPKYEYLWSINKSELQLKQKVSENFAYMVALVLLLLIAIVLLLKLIFRKEEPVRRF